MGMRCVSPHTFVVKALLCWLITEPWQEQVHCYKTRIASDEERLLEALFDGYNPSARPVFNSSQAVDVRMQFSLLHIQELNMRSQVLTTTGLLILEWFDERLKWDKKRIPLSEIAVEAKYLWRPEFASINGAESIHGEYGHFRAIVSHTGAVHWEPGGVFKTGCMIDITYYPFDEQSCNLVFGAWSYRTVKMNITNMSSNVNLDSYEENGEWTISNTQALRREFFFESSPHVRFANVVFVIHLRRRYTFYIMNVILPSLMTSILLLSVFFCTPAQKVQIGVVVLLSFRIFLLNVTDSIPRTSDHIPVLAIYLTCTLAITTLSMVLTVLILNLHYTNDRPVPYWTKRIMLFYVARLLCMCRYRDAGDDTDGPADVDRRPCDKTPTAQMGLLTTLNVQLGTSLSAGNVNSMPRCRIYRKSAPPDNGRSLDDVISMQQREERWATDWRRLGEVVDRIFFWVFASATIISTLILFHPLTKSHFSLLGDERILKKKGT